MPVSMWLLIIFIGMSRKRSCLLLYSICTFYVTVDTVEHYFEVKEFVSVNIPKDEAIIHISLPVFH